MGTHRKYVVAFLSGGSPQEPLAEFVAADDSEQTRALAHALPAIYTERFRRDIYNERIVYPGAWNKLIVVAREDDDEAMLDHALIQSRRRDRTWAIYRREPPARCDAPA
ncbi:MAG TPA: hypothetical protein VEX67_11065 [Solirubrobacteraceae bacterium]|nr:hypothetical protein [Solirubrobacteraceae bacterium]